MGLINNSHETNNLIFGDNINLYVFEVTKNLYIPEDYDRYDTNITGVFTTSSIRFYKKRLEDIITKESIEEKFPELPRIEKKRMLMNFYSILESFRFKNEKVEMRVDGTDHKGKYHFNNGMITVKGEDYIDVVPKDKLRDYLQNYGFDETKEKEILKSKILTLHRLPNKKLNYDFE